MTWKVIEKVCVLEGFFQYFLSFYFAYDSSTIEVSSNCSLLLRNQEEKPSIKSEDKNLGRVYEIAAHGSDEGAVTGKWDIIT